MGLLKTGIQFGAAYMVIDKVAKTYSNHEQEKSKRQQQQYMQYPQDISRRVPQMQYQQGTPYEPQHGHAAWCNGSCGGRCTEGQTLPQYSYSNQVVDREVKDGSFQETGKW